MADTSCRRSVWGVWIRNRFSSTVTNWETNGISYPSQLADFQQRGRIWSCASRARSCPNVSFNQVGNQEWLSTNCRTDSMRVWSKIWTYGMIPWHGERTPKKTRQMDHKRVSLEKNEKTDTLPKIVVFLLINGTVMLPIYLKVTSSITPGPVCNIDQTDSGWMLDIIK